MALLLPKDVAGGTAASRYTKVATKLSVTAGVDAYSRAVPISRGNAASIDLVTVNVSHGVTALKVLPERTHTRGSPLENGEHGCGTRA